MRLMALMAQPQDLTWQPLRGTRATLMALMAQSQDLTWNRTLRLTSDPYSAYGAYGAAPRPHFGSELRGNGAFGAALPTVSFP